MLDPSPLEVHKGLKMFVTTGSRQLEALNSILILQLRRGWLHFEDQRAYFRPKVTMNYKLIIPYPQSRDSYHFEEGGSVSKMKNRYDASYTDYAWMDFLVGTVIATALRIVQWPKPLLVPDTHLLY